MSIVAYFFMVSGGAWLSYVTVWFGLLAVMKPNDVNMKAVKDSKQARSKSKSNSNSAAANAARRRSAYYRRSSSAEQEERFDKFYVDVDQFDTYATPKMFAAKNLHSGFYSPNVDQNMKRHVPGRQEQIPLNPNSNPNPKLKKRTRGSSVA